MAKRMTDQIPIAKALTALQKSKFRSRSRFKLTDKDCQYIQTKGLDTIRSNALNIIHSILSHWQLGNMALAPPFPSNDGKQTPMKGIPFLLSSMQPPPVVLPGMSVEMASD
ncbi:hypothetical protein Dvar_53890 [Desulfosarcina variabilis str. Montpellier]